MSHIDAMQSMAVHSVPQLTDTSPNHAWRMLGALPMALSFKDVAAIADDLPDVTIGTKWRRKTWMVGERGFIWERPLGKTDIERFGDAPVPQGDILGVRVESLDAKDAILAMGLPGFFTIEHFNNNPGLLIELRKARKKDLRTTILEAHRVAVAVAAAAATKPKRRRTKRS